MFIQSNAAVLFSSSDADDATPSNYTGDDYDYVNLESKAKFDEDNELVKRTLPLNMKQRFDVLVRQSESLPVIPAISDNVNFIYK